MNAPSEVQAWSRVVWVSHTWYKGEADFSKFTKKNNVYVIRILTRNFHNIYSDCKQTNKVVIDLTTHFCLPEIRKLLVTLLNKANLQVQETHKSKHGLEILKSEL